MGYRLNRLDEPVFMVVPKPLQTEFGIHYRLESCVMFPVLWNYNLFVLTTDCDGWGGFCSWFKSSEGCWPESVLVGWTLDGLVVDARLWLGLSSSTLGAAPLEGALAWVTSGWICAVGRLLIRRLLRGEDCDWEEIIYVYHNFGKLTLRFFLHLGSYLCRYISIYLMSLPVSQW